MRQQVHEQIQILHRYREWEIGFQEAWERFSRATKENIMNLYVIEGSLYIGEYVGK